MSLTKLVVPLAALLAACSPSPPQNAANRDFAEQPAATPVPAPVVEIPVSEVCKRIVDIVMKSGAVRPGDVTREGAVLLVDERWTRVAFADQAGSAECLSHYIAGAQNKWVKKLTFKNQRTGVVYGTIENTRYRSGE